MGKIKLEIPYLDIREIGILIFLLDGFIRLLPITKTIPWLREISEILSFVNIILVIVRTSHTNKWLGYIMAMIVLGLVLFGYYPFISSLLPGGGF